MTAHHLPNRRSCCGGGGSGTTTMSLSSGTPTTKNERSTPSITNVVLPSATPRGITSRTSGASAATETLLVSVSPPSLGPPPARCISLVTDAAAADTQQQTTSDLDVGNSRTLSLSSSGHARRRPTSSMRNNGCTGSVAHASLQSTVVDRVAAAAASSVSSSSLADTDGGVTSSAAGVTLPPPSASIAAGSTAMYGGGSGVGDGPLPDDATLQSLLSVVAPHLPVDGLWLVMIPLHTSRQLHRKYELRLSPPAITGDRTRHHRRGQNIAVLVLTPSSTLRLLRSERGSVEAEAAILVWIRAELLRKASTKSQRSDRLNNNMEKRTSCCVPTRKERQTRSSDDLLPEYNDLLSCLPTVLDHCPSTRRFGLAYNILSYPRSCTPSTPSRGLSTAERRQIHYRAGRLARQAALLSSPSNRFGQALSVLSPEAAVRRRSGRGWTRQDGVDSWSLAFHALLEGILRDAEDMAVIIPYQKIRCNFRRLRHCLDKVTIPRLVVLGDIHDYDAKPPGNTKLQSTKNPFLQRKAVHEPDDEFEGGTEKKTCSNGQAAVFNMIGTHDWSHCIFGDPLMAMIVDNGTSSDFMRGFSGRKSSGKDCEEDKVYDEDLTSVYGGIVECPEQAQMRLLLYRCYHETVAIVTEFYRPRKESLMREFEARKRLNVVLTEFDAIGDDPGDGHAQYSDETVSKVRPKTQTGSDNDDAALDRT